MCTWLLTVNSVADVTDPTRVTIRHAPHYWTHIDRLSVFLCPSVREIEREELVPRPRQALRRCQTKCKTNNKQRSSNERQEQKKNSFNIFSTKLNCYSVMFKYWFAYFYRATMGLGRRDRRTSIASPDCVSEWASIVLQPIPTYRFNVRNVLHKT